MAQPQIEPLLHPFELDAIEAFVGEDDQPRREQRVALGEIGDDLALPAQEAVGREDELFVGGPRQPLGAVADFGGNHLTGGAT